MEYRAALYMRLSKEDGGGESAGIESQRLLLRSFAEARGFFVVGEYIDDGYSGTNYRRPAFERMKEDIECGKINTVITKDASRLGRNYIASGELTEEYFPLHNVRFIAINDGYDSESEENDILPFRHVLNEMYARDISRKIRSALYAKISEGQYIGSFAPYGYKKSEENRNRLVIDDEAAEVVREIFRLSSEGVSTRIIAEKLNKRNIPVPLDYRNMKRGEKGRGRLWTGSGVAKILRNQVYIGHTEQRKSVKKSFRSSEVLPRRRGDWIVVKNTHTPLVSKELFNAVQCRKGGRKGKA